MRKGVGAGRGFCGMSISGFKIPSFTWAAGALQNWTFGYLCVLFLVTQEKHYLGELLVAVMQAFGVTKTRQDGTKFMGEKSTLPHQTDCWLDPCRLPPLHKSRYTEVCERRYIMRPLPLLCSLLPSFPCRSRQRDANIWCDFDHGSYPMLYHCYL